MRWKGIYVKATHEERLDKFWQLQVIPQFPRKGSYYLSDQGFLLLGWGCSEEEGCTSSFNISLKGTMFKLRLLEND